MQRYHWPSALFVALFIMFVLGAVASPSPVTAQESFLPAPTGPYLVGTTSRHWIDEDRDETFTEDQGDKRELMVQLWYPADVQEGATPDPYLPNSDVALPLLNEGLAAFGALNELTDEFAQSPSHSFPDVPVSASQASYPVLIFSPGLIGLPTFHRAHLEELASHGYIVAGISHTYSTAVTVFPDGRMVRVSQSQPASLERLWAQDQIFVLDQLEAMNADDLEGVFTGQLNLEQVGVFGHSMGGLAAAQSMILDSRFQAGITEDGGVPGDVLREGLERPFMIMRASNTPGSNDIVFQRLQGPAYNLTFDGFVHGSFGDYPLWPDNASAPSEMVDGLRAVQITNAYILAFFNKHLKGEHEPLLDSVSQDYPEVQFQSRNT